MPTAHLQLVARDPNGDPGPTELSVDTSRRDAHCERAFHAVDAARLPHDHRGARLSVRDPRRRVAGRLVPGIECGHVVRGARGLGIGRRGRNGVGARAQLACATRARAARPGRRRPPSMPPARRARTRRTIISALLHRSASALGMQCSLVLFHLIYYCSNSSVH